MLGNSKKVMESQSHPLITTFLEGKSKVKGSRITFMKLYVSDETVFPLSCAIVLVWDTLAMSLGSQKKQISVQFDDIHFYAQPSIFDHRLLKLRVEIQKGTGWFEVGKK